MPMGYRCAHDPTGAARRAQTVGERMLNGIFYMLWTGCQWKALPKDLPPKSTVHDYLELWNWDDGTLERIHHALYVAEIRISSFCALGAHGPLPCTAARINCLQQFFWLVDLFWQNEAK
jgi:transposase